MDSLSDYEARWQQLKGAEDTRAKLFEDLVGEIRKAQDIQAELEREKVTSSHYHKLCRESGIKIENSQKDIDRNAFILVLVDGDCMPFLDTLIKDGEAGGKQAALLLKDTIFEHLEYDIPALSRDLKLVIRVYANLRGLCKTYCESGILKGREDLDRFVCGFNKDYPFCDFIDAGNGKECSDHKIKETSNWHISDPRCKHIIFGGSADNGYARMLGPCANDNMTNKRITLLEGPPFAQEMAKIADHFATWSESKLFRENKITIRRTAPASNDHVDAKPPSWANTLGTPAPMPLSNNTATFPPNTIDLSSPKPTALEKHDPNFIARNARGQRVDLPLKYYSTLVPGLKSRKLCNNYHLAGYCSFGDECKHEHGKLDERNLSTLRQIARSNPCKSGLWCDDVDCYSGHKCTHGDCIGRICRFALEMHDVDTVIVNR